MVSGDLHAVGVAFALPNIGALSGKKKFRNPDDLANASEELGKLVDRYQKIGGARAIAPHLDPALNRSHSFQVFVEGVRRIAGEM